jgi:RHS repeat-associated protein
LWNTTALVDVNGNVLDRFAYTPYGVVETLNANWTPTASPSIPWAVLFRGYFADEGTGLLHARARQYSPTLGRFVGRDPIGYVDGLSLYSGHFVPNGLDPSGMCDEGTCDKCKEKKKRDEPPPKDKSYPPQDEKKKSAPEFTPLPKWAPRINSRFFPDGYFSDGEFGGPAWGNRDGWVGIGGGFGNSFVLSGAVRF